MLVDPVDWVGGSFQWVLFRAVSEAVTHSAGVSAAFCHLRKDPTV